MIASRDASFRTHAARALSPLLEELRPLTDMGADDFYKGEDGGLYGRAQNAPPRQHLEAAMMRARSIQPLNAVGAPDEGGVVGLLAVGFSNTFLEFREFAGLTRHEPRLSSAIRPVNGAQFGAGSAVWAGSELGDGQVAADPWRGLEDRLVRCGVTALQVQAAWIKLTPREPSTLGDFPLHTARLSSDLRTVVQRLSRIFPNLRLAFLSSRAFAGYATTRLSPEPFAYESAFAVRSLIQQQLRGSEQLNFDESKGPVRSPVLLWGPYLWASGTHGRQQDDLEWTRSDFGDDGTHPSPDGARKVAHQLMTFMRTNPLATPWFLANG